MELSDKNVDGMNDDEEEDRPKNTKEEMTNNLSFVKGFVESDNLLHLKVNKETLQESKIINVGSIKLLRKDIDMLHKQEKKDESNK